MRSTSNGIIYLYFSLFSICKVDISIGEQKTPFLAERGFESGSVLLSHNLSSYYHRRNSVSLPCSEWERVVPLCHDHQTASQNLWPVCLEVTEVL